MYVWMDVHEFVMDGWMDVHEFVRYVHACMEYIHTQGHRCSQRGKQVTVQQLRVSSEHDWLSYPHDTMA